MRAASVAAELKESNPDLQVELIQSSGGVFEVTYDGRLVFSKQETGRFPDPGEVKAAVSR